MKQIQSLDEKINALVKKREQIEALRKQLEAQKKTAEKKASRTLDTRTKVLAGAVVLNAVVLGKLSPDFWRQLLDDGLVKQSDRDLFSLPPKARVSE
jgi:hypothetical protein